MTSLLVPALALLIVPAPDRVVAPHSVSRVEASGDDFETEFDEVEIGEGGTLELPAFQNVFINKLIMKDGARIQVVHAGSGEEGGPSTDGADGAHIRFFVNHIEGHVLIEARGASGGRGIDGRNGRQGADGEKGRDARVLFGNLYLGDGEDGRAGAAGEDGEDGGPGGRGGAGGVVSVYYQSKLSWAKIIADVSGGAGGKGGLGGVGGLGGNGGAGGKGINKGRQGYMGISGRSGALGISGLPGPAGRASVYQVSEQFFECLADLASASAHSLQEKQFDACKKLPALESHSKLEVISAASNVTVDQGDHEISLFSNGGDGKDAPNANVAGATPRAGTHGSDGGQITVVLFEIPENVFLSSRGGRAGHGGKGGDGKHGTDGFDGKDAPIGGKPEVGHDGQDGGKGGNGSDGGTGGAGGTIRVVYVHKAAAISEWQSHFETDVRGGTAGIGGAGGKGGVAGGGGYGGRYVNSFRRAASGRPGHAGVPGESGQDGTAGVDGTVEFLEATSFNSFIVDEFRRELEEN